MFAETRVRYIEVLFHVVCYVLLQAKNIARSTEDFVKVLYTKDLSLTIIPHFEKWQHRPRAFP